MKMSIKTKMIANGFLSIGLSITLAMVIVYVLIRNQSKETARKRVDQVVQMVSGQINKITEGLQNVTFQIGNQQDWGEKVSFIQQSKTDESFQSATMEQRAELVSFLNQLAQASGIPMIVLYDSDGDWVCAASFDKKQAYLAYPVDQANEKITQAIIPLGESPKMEQWQEAELAFPVSIKYQLPLPEHPDITMKSEGGLLRFNATAPIMSSVYNTDTNEMERAQIGLVVSSRPLDDSFLWEMGRISNTDINLFLGSRLSVGTLKSYNNIEISEEIKKPTVKTRGINVKNGLYRELNLSQGAYFEGMFPLSGGSEETGTLSILLSRAEVQKTVKDMLLSLVIIAVICLFMSTLLAWLLGNSIIRPIISVVGGLKEIAEGGGNLTKVLDVRSRDEIGELATAFNKFVKKLQWIVSDIIEDARSLMKASMDLSNLSGRMSEEAGSMNSKSDTVSASADEMNFKMHSVSAIMEEAAANSNSVAASIEEMDATVNEIAKNSEKARSVTDEAVFKTKSATGKIGELGKAAQEIGKVTETITEISEQTNLLALNATIEAARAGEAGKGFAVVANEIKELARQTAGATEEIKSKITGIQESTSSTVGEIEQVSIVIDNVNEIVSTIASSVEEQSVTTHKIADNLAQTSKGLEEVNKNIAHSSSVTEEMAKEISELNQSSDSMSNLSAEVDNSANNLSRLAEQLKERVGKFKVDDKATPKEIYELVHRGLTYLNSMGEKGLDEFNNPEGRFIWKDSYCFVQHSNNFQLIGHPFAPKQSEGDTPQVMPFAPTLAEAAKNPKGQWAEYEWPKPGEDKPTRKIAFIIQSERYPYQVGAGIWNDDFSVEELERMCEE